MLGRYIGNKKEKSMKFQGSVNIVEKNKLEADVFQLIVERKREMGTILPGQFFNIKVNNVYLRRPISVSGINENTIEFTIKIVGNGTNELSHLLVGDELDIMGPLGNGFNTDGVRKVLLIGGGIGVAPIKGLCEKLASENVEIHSVLGFRDAPYLTDCFEKNSETLTIVSETDSRYQMGFVTNPVEELLLNFGNEMDMIYVCGPHVMLEAINKISSKYSEKVQLLMEEKMACGIGACLVCTCKTKKGEGEYKHSRMCADGPMFYGSEVIFDE